MTRSIKALAIAGIIGTAAAPAFAAAHLDLNSMTCEQYNELSGADRDKVAMMAIADLNDAGGSVVPTSTATDPIVTEDANEGDNNGSLEGSANATTTEMADNDMTRYAEEIKVLNRVCSRNWDAMVTEAAAGQPGTR